MFVSFSIRSNFISLMNTKSVYFTRENIVFGVSLLDEIKSCQKINYSLCSLLFLIIQNMIIYVIDTKLIASGSVEIQNNGKG